VKPQLGLLTAFRFLGRASAIEDEPNLSVRIREAPGDSDQALAHGLGPEWSLCSGLRVFGLIIAAGAKRRAMEGVVSIDQPTS